MCVHLLLLLHVRRESGTVVALAGIAAVIRQNSDNYIPTSAWRRGRKTEKRLCRVRAMVGGLTDNAMARACAESMTRGCPSGVPGMAKRIVDKAPKDPDKMNMSSCSQKERKTKMKCVLP